MPYALFPVVVTLLPVAVNVPAWVDKTETPRRPEVVGITTTPGVSVKLASVVMGAAVEPSAMPAV
ncbi:hypothetical protein CA260_05025 [Dyella jiangningensis]|uniref:Uncharacterized protein n=1 Tax=Dyella jiangningensis TaxID=1379159 RepID=A0A328PAN4_9GAMM|nr:hypothetical protein CA260_05025 [Dyella jiangningensis]